MNHEILIANVQDHIETEPDMKALPEGTKIICSNQMCQAPIFELVTQLELGESLSLDHVRGLHPHAIKSAESCTCPTCGHPYIKNGAYHTHFGWFPYSP